MERRKGNLVLIDQSKDSLTQLFRHKDLYNRIRGLIAKQQEFSLLMIDIDNFQSFNSEKGYAQGDELLKGIAELLMHSIRQQDFVARFGGDEFAVVLPISEKEIVKKVATRLRFKIRSFLYHVDQKLGVSVGVSSYPSDGKSDSEIVGCARLAQYKSKHGGNGVICYTNILDILDSDFPTDDYSVINSIKTLINIVNIKDEYTYGHSNRVAQYSRLIGEAMGLPRDQLNNLQISAYLHDIGKIAIDEEILFKPSGLTDLEYNKVKKHPEFAAAIIKPILVLKSSRFGILQHHERHDGRGYPNGLSGNEISLEGKIIQVADSFDAMTSIRPYQKTKSHWEAQEEIKNLSGKQFDPDIVSFFLPLLQIIIKDDYTASKAT